MTAAEAFDFGENWTRFLDGVQESQVATAEASLQRLLGRDRFDGLSFVDIGCGSGLFSLAAHRLGARVHSFDYDTKCVACAETLRDRYASRSGRWTVEHGSILDPEFLGTLGKFDIAYSWGVLHHTGDMWKAIARTTTLVKPSGDLALAIYRKTPLCPLWRVEKRVYTSASPLVKRLIEGVYTAAMTSALALTGRSPVSYVWGYQKARGMTFMSDARDWLGGYPYESASPEEVTKFMHGLFYSRTQFIPSNTRVGLLGVGCDQYVFRAP